MQIHEDRIDRQRLCGSRNCPRHFYSPCQLDIPAAAPDLDRISAGRHKPVMQILVPVCKGSFFQCEGNSLRLPRSKADLFHPFQLPDRTEYSADRRLYIELNHLFSGDFPGVSNIHCYCQCIRIFDGRRADSEITVGKGRIAQAITKRKEYVDLLFVIITIAYKNTFAVYCGIALASVGKVGRIILQMYREGLRQTSAGIYISPQHGFCCSAHCLSSQVCLDHALYFVDPRHLYRRSII